MTKKDRTSKIESTLYDRVLTLLQTCDPAGILRVPDREREYEPIAAAVAQQLPHLKSQTELRHLIYDEAEQWIAIAIGPEERYDDVASKIWNAWIEWRRAAR